MPMLVCAILRNVLDAELPPGILHIAKLPRAPKTGSPVLLLVVLFALLLIAVFGYRKLRHS